MHPAIEDETLIASLQIVRICANLGPARQVNELQNSSLTLARALTLPIRETSKRSALRQAAK